MPEFIHKYNYHWPVEMSDLEIEFASIRAGGQFSGMGLLYHYRAAAALLWPEDDQHRWWVLCLQTILENKITAIQGGRDSSKTYGTSQFALVDYWAFPDETLFLISSTEMRGADYRVWGTLKDLFKRGRDRYDWLPGKVLEGKHSICTDDLEETDVRDPRKGMVFIPCFGSGGQWVGLSRYAGIKQKRRRLLGDEVQFMLPAYLDVLSNLSGGDFKGIFLGNPIGEGDPLDRIAEPLGGWGSEGEITKTTIWQNRFGGKTICLYGLDSPNFDFPQENNQKRYKYLLGKQDIDDLAQVWGDDSSKYWMQGMGVRRANLTARRVITAALCRQFGASDPCIWSGAPTTLIAGLDAAYGGVGGDRCVLRVVEFGAGMEGTRKQDMGDLLLASEVPTKTLLKVYPPIMVPVRVTKSDDLPEQQIAKFCRNHCESLGIPPNNFFFDGRATLTRTLAEIWSPEVNPVEFGGAATQRPVSQDHWIYDRELHARRLKRCDEEYKKFVTELWFSVGYAIQSGQVRELDGETILEASKREWKTAVGDRKEIETKEDMKKRTNRSPDLTDALVICVEGARRRGFQIAKMSNQESAAQNTRWLEDLQAKAQKLQRKGELNFKA